MKYIEKKYKVIERFVSRKALFVGTYKACEVFKIKNREKYTLLIISEN